MKPDPAPLPVRTGGRAALLAGGVSALLASACCLGPLVLLLLGVSGAWIGRLSALEPWQPFFSVAAIVALVFAGRRIFAPAAQCAPGQRCARPGVSRLYKLFFSLVLALVLLALGFPYIAPWFY